MAKPTDDGRTLVNWASDRVIRTLISVTRAVPYRWRVPAMGWVTRAVVAPLAGFQRRAETNLARVFPDMPQARRRRIARAAADNSGRSLIENYSNRALQERMQTVQPTGPGLAALEAAQAEGRPVILISGHFGNYEAARACLVARGMAVGGLYRPMRNPYFNDHYRQTMETMGGPVFPQGRSGTKGFIRHLKAGGVLVLLTDQYNPRGATLRFMGLPALTALSAAEMALKYQALLIPFYATRQPDGLSFAVALEAPIAPSDPETMMQAFNESLEARVRAHPEQWFWIHRRWKGPRQRSRAAAMMAPGPGS